MTEITNIKSAIFSMLLVSSVVTITLIFLHYVNQAYVFIL